MIHVQYFGDNERHSWVSSNSMIQFTNRDDFIKLSVEQRKKYPKSTGAFIIKQGTKAKWDKAVEEAMEVQPMTIEERVEAFAPKKKISKPKITLKLSSNDQKNKNKRKNSIDQDKPDTKRAKYDNVIIRAFDLNLTLCY